MTPEERIRAVAALEREFGPQWMSIAQMLGTENLRTRVGKELTSFIAFPDRGDGGSNAWRGNCSPKVVESVAKYVLDTKKYYRKDISDFTLLDPMSGSGTSEKVAKQLGMPRDPYQLHLNRACRKGISHSLRDEIKDSGYLIFFHPPYHSIIKYSGNMWGSPHPDDLSRCNSYNEFIEKLNFVIKKLYMALRKDGRLAVLVGDIRSQGKFYSMQNDMMKIGKYESFIVKAQFNCDSDSKRYAKPFIPVVTEYLLLFQKEEVFVIPFSKTLSSKFDVRKKDDVTLTWHHLVRMTLESVGGKAKLSDLYSLLEDHPKAKNNEHFRERIRATIYEHKDQYISSSNGEYSLRYKVA